MKASIRLLKEQGYSAPKQLLRIFLLALSPTEKMAMASSTDASMDSSATTSWYFTALSFMDGKNVMIALLLTLLCGAFGLCFYLRYELGKARGENFNKMGEILHGILDLDVLESDRILAKR